MSGGSGAPRYGCLRSWKNGTDVCSNQLTIRAKVADPALLAGLRAELLRPETVQYITDVLATGLNLAIDQRPALRARAEDGLRDARQRLANLVDAIEGGAGVVSLLDAIRMRRGRCRTLRFEVDLPANQLGPGWRRRA